MVNDERPLRILVVTAEVPWPTRYGGQVRTRALIEAIAERHSVVLSAGVESPDTYALPTEAAEHVDEFIPVCKEAVSWQSFPLADGIVNNTLSYWQDFWKDSRPVSLRLANNLWSGALAAVLPSIDAVLCRYLPTLAALENFPRERVIVDFDDVHSVRLQRQSHAARNPVRRAILAAEAYRARRYENDALGKVAQTLVVSHTDERRFQGKKVTIVRNGVQQSTTTSQGAARKDHPSIVLFGSMDYQPNHDGLKWFISKVWPAVNRRIPDARLIVAGQHATKRFLSFADLPNVELRGWLENLAPLVSSATVSIAPLLFGTGSRLKIIESICHGTPVISTPIGAEGLEDLTDVYGVFRESSAAKFAARMVEVLKNPGPATNAANRGSDFVRKTYSWSSTTRPLVENLASWLPQPAEQTKKDVAAV